MQTVFEDVGFDFGHWGGEGGKLCSYPPGNRKYPHTKACSFSLRGICDRSLEGKHLTCPYPLYIIAFAHFSWIGDRFFNARFLLPFKQVLCGRVLQVSGILV